VKVVGESVQLPCDSVKVWPWTVFPEIDGGAMFDGGSGDTTRVALELAGLLDPLALAAVS